MTEPPQARWRAIADAYEVCQIRAVSDALREAADLVDKLKAEREVEVERQRRRIHDLETICDPSGMVQTITSLTEQRDALLAIKAERDAYREELQWYAAETTTSAAIDNDCGDLCR